MRTWKANFDKNFFNLRNFLFVLGFFLGGKIKRILYRFLPFPDQFDMIAFDFLFIQKKGSGIAVYYI